MTAFTGNKHAWLDEVARLELSGRELRIIIAIKSAHRDDLAAVSVADLMDRTGLPRRTVQRQFDALERHGLISIERSRGGPRKHRISLLDPAFAKVDRASKDKENCATLSGAVLPEEGPTDEPSNCATLHGAVTAPSYARARSCTLTLGAPLQGAPSYDQTLVPTTELVTSDLLSPSLDAALRAAGEEAEQTGIVASVATEEIASRGRMPSSVEPDPAIAAAGIDDDEPTIEERVENLVEEISSLIADNVLVPDELAAFIDRDLDPEEDELAILEEMAAAALENERERVERHNAEIETAKATVAARRAETPLAERIHDAAHRAAYVDKLASYLVTLDREARWASNRRYHLKIVEELKRTLPRFRAEALAQDLTDEVLTGVWKRERANAPEDVVADRAARSLAFSSIRSAAQEQNRVEH